MYEINKVTNPKGKYICWYAYQGMETEGHLQMKEPECFEANSKSEALYKYLCFLAFRDNLEPYHKSLSEHLKSKYNDGGWGFCVKKIDSEEYISPKEQFEQFYKKYNH